MLSGTTACLSEECGFRNKTTDWKKNAKRLEDNLVRNGTVRDVSGHRAQQNTKNDGGSFWNKHERRRKNLESKCGRKECGQPRSSPT